MTETQRLESLLSGGNGGNVTLPRRDAQELAQKLKTRGNPGAAARLVELLNSPGDVDLEPDEAKNLLEQLRASGRSWVFGSNEARELPSLKAPEPAGEVELPEAEPPEPPVAAQAPVAEARSEPEAEPEPELVQEPVPEPEPEPQAGRAPEPEPEPAPDHRQKRGFFSRLFGSGD
jgi:outer membrane biosynthesis protein TonB